MMNRQILKLLVPATVLGGALALSGCSTSATSNDVADPPAISSAPIPAAPPGSAAPGTSTPGSSGEFITLDQYRKDPSAYSATDTVLFFNATWCPPCQRTVDNLNARNKSFPAGLTVVSVDYDTNDDLRKKYGVTYQHTFVTVNANGDQLKKWSGTESVDDIAAKA